MELATKYRKVERIGRMTDRPQIHYATLTVNDAGERVKTWFTLATVWANTQYNIGGSDEALKGGQETTQQAVVFHIRHRADVREEMRVYFNSRLYDIEAIARSNDRQYMSLRCRQYDAGDYNAPTGGELVAIAFYMEEFTGLTGGTITVTVFGGNIPEDKARVWVSLNGQEITQYDIAGDEIQLQGFDLVAEDTVTVRFFA